MIPAQTISVEKRRHVTKSDPNGHKSRSDRRVQRQRVQRQRKAYWLEVADWFYKSRIARGMTQAKVAELAGLEQMTISRLANGTAVTAVSVSAIAQVFAAHPPLPHMTELTGGDLAQVP